MTSADVLLPTAERLAPFAVHVDAFAAAALAFARDGRVPAFPTEGDTVPWSYFTVLRSQFRHGASLHELMQRDPRRGLLAGVSYDGRDAAVVGATVSAVPTMSSQRVIERSDATIVLTSVETAWSTSDGWCLTETTEMADIFGDRTPADERQPTLSGERIDHGSVSRLRIAWCCTATEDLQDVHHDADLARERGYDDVLVPGTLLAAIAEDALRNRYPSLERLSLRFTAPLYPDDSLSLTLGQQGADSVVSSEFVASRDSRPDRVVAVGTAVVAR